MQHVKLRSSQKPTKSNVALYSKLLCIICTSFGTGGSGGRRGRNGCCGCSAQQRRCRNWPPGPLVSLLAVRGLVAAEPLSAGVDGALQALPYLPCRMYLAMLAAHTAIGREGQVGLGDALFLREPCPRGMGVYPSKDLLSSLPRVAQGSHPASSLVSPGAGSRNQRWRTT